VPTDVPGINVPPATRTPGAVPVPASVALGPTTTPLDDEMSPVSKSVPPTTAVVPGKDGFQANRLSGLHYHT